MIKTNDQRFRLLDSGARRSEGPLENLAVEGIEFVSWCLEFSHRPVRAFYLYCDTHLAPQVLMSGSPLCETAMKVARPV